MQQKSQKRGFTAQDMFQEAVSRVKLKSKDYENILILERRNEKVLEPSTYLSLHWSTKAIAIYFPDKIKKDTSSWLNDLHCKKKQRRSQVINIFFLRDHRSIWHRGIELMWHITELKVFKSFFTSIRIPAPNAFWNNLSTRIKSCGNWSCKNFNHHMQWRKESM